LRRIRKFIGHDRVSTTDQNLLGRSGDNRRDRRRDANLQCPSQVSQCGNAPGTTRSQDVRDPGTNRRQGVLDPGTTGDRAGER
jgi:hypothetical protein